MKILKSENGYITKKITINIWLVMIRRNSHALNLSGLLSDELLEPNDMTFSS